MTTNEEKVDLILDHIIKIDGDLQDFRKEVKAEFKQMREKLDN